MGFGGSVQAMITTLKNNKRSRATLFEKGTDKNNGAYGKFKDSKKMSPLEFKIFQEKIIAKRKQSRKRFLIVFGTVLLAFLALSVYVLFYFKIF